MALQTALSFLSEHPMFLISILTFSFFYLFFQINRFRSVPVNWPVVGMFDGLVANRHRLLDYFTDIFREKGCTYISKGPWLLALDALHTCDPADANHIFNTNFANYPKGDNFKDVFDTLGSGIFSVDEDLWKYQRRRAHARINNPEYRSTVARLTREKVADALLPLLSGMACSDSDVDLHDVFQRFTSDITCLLVLGTDPSSLAPSFPHFPFAHAVDEMEETSVIRLIQPKFLWKLNRRLGIGTEKRMKMAREVIDQFIGRCISERREDPQRSQRSDLLTLYLDLDYNDLNLTNLGSDGQEYVQSDEFLRDSMLTFLAAGKDTISVALSWFFYLLSKNPHVEKKILNELYILRSTSSKRGQNYLSSWTVFDAEEIEGLIYLHATLCETLRLYPPVPINFKNALKADVLPSGFKVKPGMKVYFVTYATGRMETIWGKDCSEYRPERWISADGKLKREPSYKFLAYHCGPRTCLGKNMSMTQMKIAVAAIIYNFHIELVGEHVEPKLSMTLQMKNGLKVRVKKRENMEG